MARFSDDYRPSLFGSVKAQLAVLALIIVGAVTALSGYLFEEVYPDDLTVIQAPVTGHLTWYTSQGWAMQNFGTVTTYKKRITYAFRDTTGKQKPGDGLSIRFSDGGHATMFGSVQFSLPIDEKSLNKIHSAYRGNDAVIDNLIKTVVNKSVYLSGTLMTSKESYAEKKNDLIHYITDQIQNGVYKTRQTTTWVKDELTGQGGKEITKAEIIMGADGLPERQEDSVLNEFNIKAYNFTIDTMPYEDVIEAQIRNQQQITMDVQTKIAEAKKADQQALTAEAEGRANAARAKWEQETIKAREVTKAEQERTVAITNADREKQVAETAAKQRLNVAEFDRQSAEQTKQANILEGEGLAAKKKLILEADGALAQKLEAWTTSQRYWADAFSKYQGEVVPRVIMGQGQGQTTSAVQQFMDLQNMRAAADLGLNLDMKQGSAPAKK